MTVVIDPSFDPVPSLKRSVAVSVSSTLEDLSGTGAVAIFVRSEGDLPAGLPDGVDRDALAAVGFQAKREQTLVLPGSPLKVLVGVGEGLENSAQLRDALAVYARAAREVKNLAVDLSEVIGDAINAETAGQAAVEGALLSRYRYDALKSDVKTVVLESLVMVVEEADVAATEAGAERGQILSRTAELSRDLGNTPPRHLSAVKFAEIVSGLAPEYGLEVEVYDRQQLMEMGCGGLLGVNAGSTEEPRMVKIRYTPEGANLDEVSHLALVGKGIMYDSGGISLKPSNAMHAAMKLDMMGAAAVFSAMTSFRELGVKSAVTGWLMCTDNMPSGSATKLGDVLTIRGGKTVEVKNTDAEGRLVLADGLVLATEEDRRPDAIVDIATLTGAALMALGTRTAAMLANNDQIADQLQAAADETDENIWRMPLDHRYRDQLKSDVADLSNMGGQYAGLILAGLFLNDFVDNIPWGHLDIAGTMQAERDEVWRPIGSTGYGARLLAEFAVSFEAPNAD